jgi:hypothetical protein
MASVDEDELEDEKLERDIRWYEVARFRLVGWMCIFGGAVMAYQGFRDGEWWRIALGIVLIPPGFWFLHVARDCQETPPPDSRRSR